MQVKLRPKSTTRRPAPRRARATEPAAAPAPAPSRTVVHARERNAGGPQDTAHYSCGCGFAFEADVSTSVSCPHCGSGVAW